jgi:3-dehydroquinate dehydratase/shikimate dehydrogenase
MIIVSITGPSQAQALRQMTLSRRYASLFELRLDLIADAVPEALISAAKRPVVATCRPVWEGGVFSGSEQDRFAILSRAVRCGASYVDIELAVGARAIRAFAAAHHGIRIIVSRHYFSEGTPDPRREYNALRSVNSAVMKLAYRAADGGDIGPAMRFLQLARRDRRHAIAVAMGEAGEASRVLYRVFGGWATFAAPEGGVPAADGQLSARMMHDLFRAHRLNRATKIFGVIGHPVRYSKGIHLHNPLFQRAGRNAVYCRFDVERLASFMQNVFPALSGVSVTQPHKLSIMDHVDRVDDRARRIGAVNTVFRRGGRLVAENTDAAGALDAIERKMRVKGKTFLVLGAGGAARAIIVEALQREATVFVANRTRVRADELARATGCQAVDIGQVASVDIVANATSVGMAPRAEESPLTKGAVRMKLAFDAVYQPADTRFLKEARALGAMTVSGAEMYLNQAAAQSRRYTGVAPDRRMMRRLLVEALDAAEI